MLPGEINNPTFKLKKSQIKKNKTQEISILR